MRLNARKSWERAPFFVPVLFAIASANDNKMTGIVSYYTAIYSFWMHGNVLRWYKSHFSLAWCAQQNSLLKRLNVIYFVWKMTSSLSLHNRFLSFVYVCVLLLLPPFSLLADSLIHFSPTYRSKMRLFDVCVCVLYSHSYTKCAVVLYQFNAHFWHWTSVCVCAEVFSCLSICMSVYKFYAIFNYTDTCTPKMLNACILCLCVWQRARAWAHT